MILKAKLLRDRYLQPNEKTEEDMYDRVSKFIAGQELGYRTRLYKAMCDGVWLPNTPTLVNAGVPGAGGLSACYVLPIEDSLDGIYRTVWHAARVHKYFGGTGFNFSGLRERGALIKSTGGKACGPIKVMELLNESAGVVSQGGKREGANMGILNASHKDVKEFIHCKDSRSKLSHFNISVGLTDDDMVGNSDVVADIAKQAWKTGDPGVIFLDRLNEGNEHLEFGKIECTNPCGEQPLRPYESCNLGSINVSKFWKKDDFDMADFKDTIWLSVRALNDIMDLNVFPIQEIERATYKTRKIGSGIMGWADLLIMMGYGYESKEAISLIHSIGNTYMQTALGASEVMGSEFGNYTGGSRRNETLLTIAPTGTLSYLAGCSWGIEPIFDWVYTRESESGIQTMEHPLTKLAKEQGLSKDIAKNISMEAQIQQMATWQQYVDNAVSKTINLPSTATVDDVEQAIYMAWEMRCKGITVYRDGSKLKQVVTSVKTDIKPSKGIDGHNIERFGSTLDYTSGCGRIHITTNDSDKEHQHPYEVYILSDGGCPANNEAIGKIISKYLHDPRLDGDERTTVGRIVRTLSKVDCPTAMRNSKAQGKSCADIIAKRMRDVWLKQSVIDENICPQCGAVLSFGKGCRSGTCVTCGWSGCS